MIFSNEPLSKELCWKLYLKAGSGQGFGSVVEELAKSGVANPQTGRPYTKMHVRYCAYSYALNISTRDEAKRDFKEVFERVHGKPMTEDDWNQWLVKIAKSIYYQRPTHYEKWIRGNGLQRYARVSSEV